MRINARLDEESEKDLDFILQTTGGSATIAVKKALADYANRLRADMVGNNQALLRELAGIGEGPEDLSENYKRYLTEGQSEKQRSS